ncbi:hypothetical protein PFDSM3638_01330 [Pyrococcus furiosus DSM 3638]|uniref:Uncharacterized protein n=3 Tax=Pyrococcus furiosus TaxID=2261 RepID=Q8U417_PYRFU|nr:hypothetical protein [Pyrococcus furiosus]AAL80404.1 hypothetical protein PF0280 [Pyrococcus furiosus DSM 3638]AFN03067.1 hypothetical protein PFC_00465 [Pyrococcus furiosus COM1]QEK77997.1 hypothetical protein PFDSM3638_01330 [Pyrococcus furiosus DSM 3638]
MTWREILRKEGFLDLGEFIVELVYIDCPCEPIPPTLAIYDKKGDEWYKVEEAPNVQNYREAVEWAIEVLERIRDGENVKLVSLDGPAPPKVMKRLSLALQKLTE